jgi:hypothetical protein
VGTPRIDLQGRSVGVISAGDAANAKHRLKRRQQATKPSVPRLSLADPKKGSATAARCCMSQVHLKKKP